MAGLYQQIVAGMVIDRVDADQQADIEALGLRTRSAETLMSTPAIARGVAEAALELCRERP